MRHSCGIAAAHSLHDIYSYIDTEQHRGREAAGIAAIGERRIDVVKWIGLVKDFSLTDLHKIFPAHRYHTYLGHVRYATRGRKDKILEDAHPHTIGGTIIDRNSHIFILDCEMAIIHNGQVGNEYLTDIDRSHLHTGCDTEALLHFYRKRGEYELMQKIPGAYTLAIADKNRPEVIVMRDRTGIKPGVLGQKDGKYNVVSEDIALRKNGARFIEDLIPGSIYYLDANGNCRKICATESQPAYCFFEWNYIAHIDTVLNGMNVLQLRIILGETLAQETPLKGLDWISYMPRCPEVASRSCAAKLGAPFDDKILYKMKTERAFQGSTADERKKSISENLYLQPEAIGRIFRQTGAIIDDSTIRGNNARQARDLLYQEARVKECRLLNYTPPVGIVGADKIPRGCMFGVDMPPDDNFIARGRSLKEISATIGMPVQYISPEGMLRGFEKLGIPRENLCTYCIGGKHPFKSP